MPPKDKDVSLTKTVADKIQTGAFRVDIPKALNAKTKELENKIDWNTLIARWMAYGMPLLAADITSGSKWYIILGKAVIIFGGLTHNYLTKASGASDAAKF